MEIIATGFDRIDLSGHVVVTVRLLFFLMGHKSTVSCVGNGDFWSGERGAARVLFAFWQDTKKIHSRLWLTGISLRFVSMESRIQSAGRPI